MFQVILIVHTVLCLILIGLVLLQQGKGADMGAAFGGGSNTLFGASGATNFVTRFTTGTCVAFMITSIMLVRSYQQGGFVSSRGVADPLSGSVMEGMIAPAPQADAASQPADTGAPGAAPAELPPPAKAVAPEAPKAPESEAGPAEKGAAPPPADKPVADKK